MNKFMKSVGTRLQSTEKFDKLEVFSGDFPRTSWRWN